MPPNDSPAVSPLPTAPRRARPLHVTCPSPDPQAVAAALAIARSKSADRSAAPTVPKSRHAIETKIAAAGYDADTMLRTLDTEMALRRAGRTLKGDDQIQAFRVISIAMLFTLLIAALGAMSYMQTQFAGHGFKHHAASASPTPDPSTPAAGPDRQSARPTR